MELKYLMYCCALQLAIGNAGSSDTCTTTADNCKYTSGAHELHASPCSEGQLQTCVPGDEASLLQSAFTMSKQRFEEIEWNQEELDQEDTYKSKAGRRRKKNKRRKSRKPKKLQKAPKDRKRDDSIDTSSSLPTTDKLIMSNPGDGKLLIADMDGSNLKDFVSGVTPCAGVAKHMSYYVDLTRAFLSSPHGIAIDVAANKIFYADALGGFHEPYFFNATIYATPLDGSVIMPIVTEAKKKEEPPKPPSPAPFPHQYHLERPWSIDLDRKAQKVYWTDTSHKRERIQRANYDGSNVEDLILDMTDAKGIAVDADHGMMYFVDDNAIYSATLDGADKTKLKNTFGFPDGIALDSARGHIYWAERYGRHKGINRMNLDGHNFETIVGPEAFKYKDVFQRREKDGKPESLFIDAAKGYIYWTDSYAGTLKRAKIDGSDVKQLIHFPGSYMNPSTVWGVAIMMVEHRETITTTTTTTTSSTVTTLPPGVGPLMFRVTQGYCKVDSENCLTSPSYPNDYPSSSTCSIRIIENTATPIRVVDFETEKSYDKLRVDWTFYSGTNGPEGIVPKRTIVWKSDSGSNQKGFRLCPTAN